MLEIRNVTKTYRSKTGESVKALDNISISFPESGMVFILGKSGSGKSTLLNAIGGLDSIDSGEFIIMGKSSRDFVGSDFDAYRNTFIGFIFQEYNVLDEFTVGANIALALELQGKKATDEQINKILAQVDLLSFAKRKPNELSGGQKQRVAIARALVKDPQIIMADEPTGALDSNTGKQIFDTLKELSKEKLVLIVSHDRDFAERYADRIVELADGHIISDVTKHEVEGKSLNDGIRQVSRHILQIKGGYRLTPADVEMINNYLATSPEGVILSGDNRVNGELRSAAGITEEGGTTVFEGTKPEKDVPLKQYDGQKTRFIRSRLPMKNAVRMGASGLKHKRFRLVLTILLSLVAFAMFGLADTMAAYDKVTAATESILDTNTANASVSLALRHSYNYDDGRTYSYYNDVAMNDTDIAYLKQQTGLSFVPVYNGVSGSYTARTFSLTDMMASEDYQCEAYGGKLYGFTTMTAEDFAQAGLTLTGRMPENSGEIVISEFVYRQFNLAGFVNEDYKESVAKNQLTMDLTGANSIIGKHLNASKWFSSMGAAIDISNDKDASFVIVGVVDTKFDYDRYQDFLPKEEETGVPSADDDSDLTTMLLQIELLDTLRYGFHTLGYVSSGDIDTLSQYMEVSYREYGSYINFGGTQAYWTDENGNINNYYLDRMAGSDQISSLNVYWLDGTKRTALAANEYLLSQEIFNAILSSTSGTFDTSAIDAKAQEKYGDYWSKVREVGEANGWGYEEMLIRAAGAMSEGTIEMGEWTNSSTYGDAWTDVKTSFLPDVAQLYGVTLTEQSSTAMWEIFSGILSNIRPGETLKYWDNLGFDRLISIYCLQDIETRGLLFNASFMEMVRADYEVNNSGDFSTLSESEKLSYAHSSYLTYLRLDYNRNAYGEKTYAQFQMMANLQYPTIIGSSAEELLGAVGILVYDYRDGDAETVLDHTDWKLVGIFDNSEASNLIVSDTFISEVETLRTEAGYSIYEETVAEHESGIWAFAIAAMPKDRATVEKLVRLSYAEDVDLQFSLQNQVMNTLDTFNSFIEVGAQIFLYVGIGFAVFSALLLMNFISVSISYKKREIGILRAVGARSSDVFKIFFSEAFIIAFINFVLAIVAVLTSIFFLNRWMYNEGINITLLNFGIRQVLLMLLVSVAVAAISSFLPVWHIARKKPVDAIKNL